MTDAGIPAGSGTLPGYLATPLTPGPWPGVVVVHEAFGLTDDIRQSTDRLATAGYRAFAPRLFAHGSRPLCLVRTFQALASGSGAAVDDILAAREYLASGPDATGAVGILGFCLGGGFALLLGEHFTASAPNYGVLPRDAERLARACPTVASYGKRDRAMRGTAAKLESALEAAGVSHDVKEYPDAGHSFLNRHPVFGPLRVIENAAGVGYHHASAQDAWERILRFFGEHLGAPSV